MHELVILNQHKGEYTELINHIENYLSVWINDYFFMVLVVDQALTTEQMMELTAYNENHKEKLIILFNYSNKGLSQSRYIAMKWAQDHLKDRQFYLLGATNTKWINPLTEKFYTEVSVALHDSNVALMKCSYDDTLYQRMDFKYNSVTFSDFLNNINRPDMTLMFEANSFEVHYRVIEGEPYIPELDVMQSLTQIGGKDLIYKLTSIMQTAWYNDKGMSKTFDRSSITRNKKGYYITSKRIIDGFINGTIALNADALKVYLTHLVTCGEDIPLREYRNTFIYSLLLERISKWAGEGSELNKLIFQE